MAHDLEELPLFPLHTVLFPYAPLQLHIFEDRYKQMLADCIDFEQPFGIVLIRSGSESGTEPVEPYMVGTAVRIVKYSTYDDGQMDISVQGERRIRIRRIDESKPYLVGFVEPVVEMELEDTPRTDALTMRVRESFEMLIEGTFSRSEFNVQVRLPDDPTILSFAIAHFLPLENIEKQRLLETTDTLERLTQLRQLIERQIVHAKTPAYYKLTQQHLSDWMNPN